MKRLRKLLSYYLVLTGLLAHVGVVAAGFLHYRASGLPAPLYVKTIAEKLEKRVPGLGVGIESVAFGSGLFEDPAPYMDEQLVPTMPAWRGQGASLFRSGWAEVSLDRDRLDLRHIMEGAKAPHPQAIPAGDSRGLANAIAKAQAGDVIRLSAGLYQFSAAETLLLTGNGSKGKPITITGAENGGSVLAFDAEEGIAVNGRGWVLERLILRGRCDGECSALLTLGGDADNFVFHNNFLSGFAQLLSKSSQLDEVSAAGFVGNTLLSNTISDPFDFLKAVQPNWAIAGNRFISLRDYGSRMVAVCGQDASATARRDCNAIGLQAAIKAARPGQMLLLRSGIYSEAAFVDIDNLYLLAEPHAVVTGKAVGGKAAFVMRTDTLTIDGLECHGITVSDRNGACIRQEKGTVNLKNVYFHHSQNGLLSHTGSRALNVWDSVFYANGQGEYGRTHNIYVNGGALNFVRSYSVGAVREGHELKTRGDETLIQDSVIASFNSKDSRQIDITADGRHVIRNNLIQQGPFSSNEDVIGLGLEMKQPSSRSDNEVIVENNLFYLERFKGNTVVHLRNLPEAVFRGNTVIGKANPIKAQVSDLSHYSDRRAAGAPPFPTLDWLR